MTWDCVMAARYITSVTMMTWDCYGSSLHNNCDDDDMGLLWQLAT